MKKLLAIVVLGLLWSASVYADCTDDLDFENKWYNVKYPYQEFTFKNKSKNTIEILTTGIYAKNSKDIVIEWNKAPIIVFGYRQLTFSKPYLGNLNPDILGNRYYTCRYTNDFDYIK